MSADVAGLSPTPDPDSILKSPDCAFLHWQLELAMTEIPASHRDLLQSAVATLATIGPDERPQLTEVWFLEEEGSVAISLNTSRQKTKNLSHRPECSLLILDLAAPQRYLEIRGDADIRPDDDYAFADMVGQKYGTDLRAHDGPGDRRVVVRIRPYRVIAVDMRG